MAYLFNFHYNCDLHLIQCSICNQLKPITRFIAPYMNFNLLNCYICTECINYYKYISLQRIYSKQCDKCKFFYEMWEFEETTLDGICVTYNTCLNCRMCEMYKDNMLKNELNNGNHCKRLLNGMELFKVNNKYAIVYNENGIMCEKCLKRYNYWYLAGGICYKCRYINDNVINPYCQNKRINCSTYLLMEEDDEDNNAHLKRICDEYISNNIKVKCRKCRNYYYKTNMYGSVRRRKIIEYERGDEYICIDCAVKTKKDDKSINFKRIFNDEDEGGRKCNKCYRSYPLWHYVIAVRKNILLTSNCLECRNLEKLTKTLRKKKLINLKNQKYIV